MSRYLPHLSRPQSRVLAWWSCALVFVHHSGMTMAGAWLAQVLGGTEQAWRQRLREWCYDAADKKGEKRAQIEVRACFGPLLQWIISWWDAGENRLALALDATTLSDRFTVLSVSVLYRGCALPVAWSIIIAGEKGEWKCHWIALLKSLQGCIPDEWMVIVMADRGLYARWLYQQIQALGWHPFLRINLNGKVRPQGERQFRWLSTLVTSPGEAWSGRVTCFSDPSKWIICSLLVQWDQRHVDPWIIITDLPVSQATCAWYGMRFWIECQFKDHKRGGWHWHLTRMSDPRRAERLWLVQAVALLWMVSIGGQSDGSVPASSLQGLDSTPQASLGEQPPRSPRRLSCVSRGIIALLAAVVKATPLPRAAFVPFPWPTEASCSPALQSRGGGP